MWENRFIFAESGVSFLDRLKERNPKKLDCFQRSVRGENVARNKGKAFPNPDAVGRGGVTHQNNKKKGRGGRKKERKTVQTEEG